MSGILQAVYQNLRSFDAAAPAATPAFAGASFEGGYYVGLQWNQLCQSTSSVAIATGTKTFTIDVNQAITALFYIGQTVMIRSRAQNYYPNNDQGPGGKSMIGTVAAGTTGTTLVVTVTSINSTGTYADWSVMARHRLIVSPKASGQFATSGAYPMATTIGWATNVPAESQGDSSDGKDMCARIRAAAGRTSVNTPAAFYVSTLSIGGYTDWYIPGPDELILAHRYLKADPNTTNITNTASNNTTTVFAYGRRGSFTKMRSFHVNNNSDPQVSGNSYVQAPAGVNFRAGESEAFFGTYAAYFTMDMSDYVFTKGWTANAGASSDGPEAAVDILSTTIFWRAFRRSVI